MSINSDINQNKQIFNEKKQVLKKSIDSINEKIEIAQEKIENNFEFIIIILEDFFYNTSNYDIDKFSSETSLTFYIDKYMDLSSFLPEFEEIQKTYKLNPSAQISFDLKLEEAISKWINANLSYINSFIPDFAFYLKYVCIEKYYIRKKKLRVKISISIDIK